MKKLEVSLMLLGLLIGLVGVNIFNPQRFATKLSPISLADLHFQVSKANKAKIVTEINWIDSKIDSLERKSGKSGSEGYKIYTAQETKEFIALYQNLLLLAHYLNYGDFNVDIGQWEGYPLNTGASKPYSSEQVFKVMNDLAKDKVPESFIANLRIYLLPYVIPDVSGLGGTGYILLSAQPAAEELIANQLQVTLYHEIGHHVNFSFMPRDTVQGGKLWGSFLQIRGGKWHGPGNVNTTAWGESSEETFAEDFRMLFGKDQPFFGDLALGDPRSDSGRAKRETDFIVNLANHKAKTGYESPWIPRSEIAFWRFQGLFIPGMWLLLGAGIIAINGLHSFQTRRRTGRIIYSA